MILRYLRVSELMKYDKNSLRTLNAMTVSSFYSEVVTGIKTNPKRELCVGNLIYIPNFYNFLHDHIVCRSFFP